MKLPDLTVAKKYHGAMVALMKRSRIRERSAADYRKPHSPIFELHKKPQMWRLRFTQDSTALHPGYLASSPRHEEVLADRDAMYQRGEDAFEDWEVAKRNIRNRLS